MAVASTGGGDFRIGDVMSRAWRLCTGNLLFFLAVPFIINIITFVGALVFGLLFVFAGMGMGVGAAGMGAGSVGLIAVGVLLIVILAIALYVIGQGVLLLGAFQRLRGQAIRVGEALQRVLHRFLPLVGVGFLWVLTVGVSAGIVVGLAAVVGGGFLAFVLGLAAWVLLTIVFVMWAVAVPVCIVEEFGPVASLSRSAELTKGFRWKIFGILFLLGLVLIVAYIVQVVLGLASQALGTVFGLVWSVFWTAYLNCTIIMMYHDLRVAKEGVDTEQIASIFD